MSMMRGEGTPTTVSGRVVSIDAGELGGRGGGLILKVESDSRIIPVHLGPAWRHEDISGQIEKNDRIEISGMRVTRNGQSRVIAREITLNDDDKVLTLRAERPDRPEKMERRTERMHRRMKHHPRAY